MTDSCHWCQIRSFPTHAQYPITIVNKTGDGAQLPGAFRFITQNILTDGVQVSEASFHSGCACRDPRACRYDGCACLSDMLWEEDESMQPDDSGSDSGSDGDGNSDSGRTAAGGQLQQSQYRHSRGQPRQRAKFAYHSRGAKAGLLRSRYLDSREPIYECHEACACYDATAAAASGAGLPAPQGQPAQQGLHGLSAPPSVPAASGCPNRVVERGRRVPLQIFRTEDRGWGVRTLVDIEKGQFVDRYIGEVLTVQEANRRRAAATMARRKDVYLFALDKFSDAASLDQRLAGPPLECDGEFRAGPTRFINHSCDPNLRIFARVGDHADKHIHDLAFFAVRTIAAGDELTFDYVDGLEDMDSDAQQHVAGMTPCLCKSANCRKFLW